MRSLFAFLGGAAVGAAVALLFAPEKGSVTRRKIANAASDGKDKIYDAVEKGSNRLGDAYHHSRDRVEDVISEGRDRLAEAIHTGKKRLEKEIEMAICEEESISTKKKKR